MSRPIPPPPNRHSPRACSPRAGFTLIELTIVIGVLGLLIGLLLAGAARARRQAWTVLCANNLRQMDQALVLYASDNATSLPMAPWIGCGPTPQNRQLAWTLDDLGVANFQVGSIYKYFGESEATRARLMSCPADLDEKPILGNKVQAKDRNFSYSLNVGLNRNTWGNPHGPTLGLSEIRNPSAKILIFEEHGPNDGMCVCNSADYDDYPTNRHSGQCNAAFADGHVERVVPKTIFANPVYCDLLSRK